jgi:DNA polymerase
VRFTPGATTDWREALRNAGATRPIDALSPPVAGTSSPSAGIGAGSETPAAAPVAPATGDTPVKDLPAWLAALGLPLGIEAGRLRVIDAAPELATAPTLSELADHVAGCRRCALHKSATHHVSGEGNPIAELLCVGEAPGADEDAQGRPFVGEAGELLTKILGAIQLAREDVYICNVLKHRPPGNRDPLPDEIVACQPYLLRQIELVRPRVILALGRIAAQTLLHTTTGIGALRGRIHRFHGVPLIVTYHPASLLRNEAWKRPTWEDVKLARRLLDASRSASTDPTAP